MKEIPQDANIWGKFILVPYILGKVRHSSMRPLGTQVFYGQFWPNLKTLRLAGVD